MTYADSIAQQLVRAVGGGFVGKITFHVPPRGRIRMVAETKLHAKVTAAIDKGRVTDIRSVANR